MTRMTVYEEGKAGRDKRLDDYFWGDYVAMEILISLLVFLVAALTVAAVYVLYNFETLLSDVYQMDLMQIGLSLIKRFLWASAAYCIVTAVVYSVRFAKAKKRLRAFGKCLAKIDEISETGDFSDEGQYDEY